MLPARPHVRHFISHKDTLVSNITAPSVGKNSKLKPGCTFPFFFFKHTAALSTVVFVFE